MRTDPVNARVLSGDDYWALREPFDQYLPDSVPAEEVEADLAIMQARFRDAMDGRGQEDDDWEFPGHYQHVRVFYVYLNNPKLYTPELTSAIRGAMAGFERPWIGEFECYSLPGREEGLMTIMLYQAGDFIFTSDDEVGEFLPALGLTEQKTG
jgi:hypothetical protein